MFFFNPLPYVSKKWLLWRSRRSEYWSRQLGSIIQVRGGTYIPVLIGVSLKLPGRCILFASIFIVCSSSIQLKFKTLHSYIMSCSLLQHLFCTVYLIGMIVALPAFKFLNNLKHFRVMKSESLHFTQISCSNLTAIMVAG